MAQQRGAPSPEEIATQVQILREQIGEMQAFIAQLDTRLRSVQTAKATIEALKEHGPTLFAGDPELNVMIKAKVEDPEKPIVHLGINIYAALDKEKAIKVLERKEEALKKSIDSLKSELDKLVKTHDQYIQMLQAVSMQQAALQAQGRQSEKQG